jgi:hypothetical protein
MHGEPPPGVEMGKLRLEEILFENASLPAEILQLDHLGYSDKVDVIDLGPFSTYRPGDLDPPADGGELSEEFRSNHNCK